MALVLEGAHPLERNGAADVDVRRGDVDSELHPQRPAAARACARARPRGARRRRSGSARRGPRAESRGTGRARIRGFWLRRQHSKANGKRRRRIRKLRLLTLLLLVGLLCFVSFAYGMVLGIRSDIPQLDQLKPKERQRDGVIYDSTGHRVLARLVGSESRKIVSSDQIAAVMKQAIVAIEDKRFFEHRGVDVRGIARAVWQDVRNKKVVQGGSTITQQFVKNAYLTSKRSISRKLKEAALAWQLDQVWSKDRILTNYLNTIYFGNGAYGIERAAQIYFGHGAVQADACRRRRCLPASRAIRASTTRSRTRKPTHARRREVLQAMLDQKDIAYNEFRLANRTPLPKPEDDPPPRDCAARPSTSSTTSSSSSSTSTAPARCSAAG